ncbi:hypothetical protein DM02DRAFT_466397, partial [Periconia macrospinosa]
LPVALAQGVFPAPISLVNTTYGGSGCPAGSVVPAFNSSLLSLQFNATRYAPSLGQGIGVAQNRKNCQIRAEILVPTNYSLTIWQNRVFGAAQLSEGVTAQFLTTVYLSSGVQQTTSFRQILKGPVNAPFAKTEETAFETPWTPCGASVVVVFNFNTQVRLDLQNQATSNASGVIEPMLSQNYDLTWMTC